MIVNRMIDKYVETVLRYLPVWKKRRARVELRAYVKDVLSSYCEGERPTLQDAREVFRIIGKPKRVAALYLSDKRGKVSIEPELLGRLQIGVSLLSVFFIIIGLISLSTGTARTGFFVAGLVLALVLAAYRMLSPYDKKELSGSQRMGQRHFEGKGQLLSDYGKAARY